MPVKVTLMRAELRATLTLGLPLVIAFAGNQALGLVDTMIAGRLGYIELAGTGLGNALYFLFIVLGFGVLMALDPIASQAHGAGDRAAARRAFYEASIVAGLLVGPIMAAIWFGSPWALAEVGATDAAAASAMHYLTGRLPGTLFFLLVIAQRGYLQAQDITRPIVLSVLAANVVNLPLSSFLGAGDACLGWIGLDLQTGFAGWGEAGIGAASSVVSAVQCGVLALAIRRLPRPPGDLRPSSAGITRLFAVGAPIGLTFFGEAGAFTVVTMLMAGFGDYEAGAHQVALQLASFTFTVCLGISSAASVRVGQAIGRGDGLGARRAGVAATLLGVGFMGITALHFLLLPGALARLIAVDPIVIEMAIPLLMIAGAFQLFDGLQAVMQGALRGLADTRFAMIAALTGYWAIAMPVGYYLAYSLQWGPRGLWWGLTIGLAIVGVIVTLRFWTMATRQHALERS